MPLVTDDITGVEVLRTGTFRGRGSVPGGDTWTDEDLHQAVAATAARLEAGEAIPVKVGHGDNQAAIIGDAPDLLDETGKPALGWVRNPRVVGDRLLVDLAKVPRRFADLLRTGAYRARSVEWRPGDRSLAALAVLGAQAPAITSLADVFRLYEANHPDPDVAYSLVENPPAPTPDGGADTKSAAGDTTTTREHGMDIRKFLGLSEDATDEQVQAALSGVVQAAAAAKDLGDQLAAVKAELDQVKAGLEKPAGDASPDVATVAQEAAREAVAAYAAEQAPVIEALTKRAEQGEDAARVLYAQERDRIITAAIEGGKIAAADRDKWAGWYDANPGQVQAQIDALPVNPVLYAAVGTAAVAGDSDHEDAAFRKLMAGIPGVEVK